MKRRLVILVITAAGALGFGLTDVSPAAAAGHAATVSHYSATYPCPCFGVISMTGVHLTNVRFPGTDNGHGSAIGGRDNFSGSVTHPPTSRMMFSGGDPNDPNTAWCSDYDGQASYNWEWVINTDGSQYGWAVYPNHNSPCPFS